MRIQVNSDSSVAVDAGLTRLVEGEVDRILGRFAGRLTRVEVHLSSVYHGNTVRTENRCMVEVRPVSARPRSASASAAKMPSAIDQALGKMRRSLTTFFGRVGRPAAPVPASRVAKKQAAAKKVTARTKTKLNPPGTKKAIHQS